MPPPRIRPYRTINTRMVQNFNLVWLDRNINRTHANDPRHPVGKLRDVFVTVDTFNDADKSIEFITKIQEKTFLVVSDEFLHPIIPIVQDMPQVNYIYILSHNDLRNEIWSKVSGVYNDVTLLCQALRHAVQHCDHNSFSISFVQKTDAVINQSFDTFNSSFMFTRILKDILLTIDFDQEHIKNFFTYCREQFADNNVELKNIDMVEKEYHSQEPIWWYTYDCFLYFMLNRALRTMEVDLITKMGFFVRDLHNHITRLHAEQYSEPKDSNSFVVYRGQGLSQTDFAQLETNQDGLLAFNNFLSTSQNADVSLKFARHAVTTSHSVGVLFIITVNPSISATTFANVETASYYEREEEILFSMQSVFRIGQMQRIEEDDRLWQVKLTLTSNDDPQLQTLTNSIKNKVERSTEWFRLGEFSKAAQVYELLLDQISDDRMKAEVYRLLGRAKDEQGNYAEAILAFKKSLEIVQILSPIEDINLSDIHYHLGDIYAKMGAHLEALSYLTKALEIRKKLLPPHHSLLGLSHFKTATVLHKLHRNEEALKHATQAVAIASHNAVIEQSLMQTIEEQLYEFLSTILSKDEIEGIKMAHWMYPVLLVLSSSDQSRLLPIFHDITNEHLFTPISMQQCVKNLSLHKQVKSIAVELSIIHPDERDSLLEVLSSYPSVDSIYILGKPSTTDEERSKYFTRFPKISIFCENPTQLVIRWMMDTIEDYRTLGDQQIKENQKSKARIFYHRGMQLFDQLSKLINAAKQQ